MSMSHFICKCSIDVVDSNLSLFNDVDGAGQSGDCNCSGNEHNSSDTANQFNLGFILNDEFIFDIQ